MRCRSCSENIDSKYRYALANNVCPICGQKLLSDAMFNFRIKVTHILESHEVDPSKTDMIATEIMNTIMRAFTEDKQSNQVPTSEQKRASASDERKIVKFGNKKQPEEEIQEVAEFQDEQDLRETNPDDPDDPNNPENKKFLEEMGWDPNAPETKTPPRTKPNPLIKKLPNPISRLS